MASDFTVSDVLAWARTKPADERYDFTHAGECALGQFAREVRGYSKLDADCGFYEDHGLVSDALLEAAAGPEDSGDWQTFGAFVERLEQVCPTTPVTRSNWLSIDAYLTDIESMSA
jgi:hypothetical protein